MRTFPPALAILRPHHWLKNILVVVPLVAAHRFDWTTARSMLLAFVCLSLCASGGYVLNDWFDLRADRQHPRKQFRPMASGRLSPGVGVLLAALTWSAGFGLAAWTLPDAFVWTLVIYVAGSLCYSFRLRSEPVLDVVLLASLYVWRIIAGGAAAAIPVSTWLLAFTLFLCLSLALMKRFIEVVAQPTDAGALVPGRGYLADDAQWLHAAGLAAAYLSVVILAIYVNNPDVTRLYSHPDRLLLMCPILVYWSTRVWLSAHRRQTHDDPVFVVAGDPVTYVLLAICAIIVASAV